MKTLRQPATGVYLNITTVRVISGKWCVKGCFNFRFKAEPDFFSPLWKTWATFENRELAIDFAEKIVEAWQETVVSDE